LDHKICYNYSLTRWLVEWEMLGLRTMLKFLYGFCLLVLAAQHQQLIGCRVR
jgi:hypothetical protein